MTQGREIGESTARTQGIEQKQETKKAKQGYVDWHIDKRMTRTLGQTGIYRDRINYFNKTQLERIGEDTAARRSKTCNQCRANTYKGGKKTRSKQDKTQRENTTISWHKTQYFPLKCGVQTHYFTTISVVSWKWFDTDWENRDLIMLFQLKLSYTCIGSCEKLLRRNPPIDLLHFFPMDTLFLIQVELYTCLCTNVNYLQLACCVLN